MAITSDSIARHLVRADPAFETVVRTAGPFALPPPREDPFNALARAIVSQQLAGRAAAAIHRRFLALFDTPPTAPAVLAAGLDTLRGCGLSGAKATAITDLAQRATEGRLDLAGLPTLTDDEVVARLSGVRGVGRWTAEMYLLFDLRRPDVWPVGDYGVRKGWALLHDLAELPAPRELQALGEGLRPHRSAAAWYCWRGLNLSRTGAWPLSLRPDERTFATIDG